MFKTGKITGLLKLIHIQGIIVAKALPLVMVVLLSGCTSSQMMSSGCDFVVGGAQSQQRQAQNLAMDRTDTNQEMNVINGFLQMLLGPINRSLGGNECSTEDPDNMYPNVAL